MTSSYEAAREELRNHLEDYLTAKGVNLRTNFKCLAGKHEDAKPSMSYDRKRNKVHCFSCNADMDIIDLIKVDYNITDDKEAFKKGYELYNIHIEHKTDNTQQTQYTDNTHKTEQAQNTQGELSAYFSKCASQLQKTSYLKDRGLSEDVLRRFNVGYDEHFNRAGVRWQAVIIPTSANTYVARNTDATSKDRYRKQGESQLFNLDAALQQDNPIFIVEGEIDALSVIDAGMEAIGLGSLNNDRKLLEVLKERKPANVFVLALDKDENNRGQEKQAELLYALKALDLKVIEADITGENKDANEALRKDKEGFKKRLNEVQEEAIEWANPEKAYKKNYASNYIDDFLNGIKERANTPYVPTGFKQLDYLLDGGLFEGLYFIGGVSSVGKTTFMLQLADQIAGAGVEGYDVLIFSLEMARNELIAKSVSRNTFILSKWDKEAAKSTREVTTYSRYFKYSNEEINLINNSIVEYSKCAKNIVIREGVGDISVASIRKAVDDHIRYTGRKPIVIIDYLQIIAPTNDRMTDKQNTDKAVTELKRISRDYKLSVFAISSLNRINYSSEISMQAFKESGAIEYSSDVLLGLQFEGQGKDNFNIEEAKQAEPRNVELKILKNRNGRTGRSVLFEYYPKFNFMKEKTQGGF